jgi:hypothetical protein
MSSDQELYVIVLEQYLFDRGGCLWISNLNLGLYRLPYLSID